MRKILSMLIVCIMLIGSFSVTALADTAAVEVESNDTANAATAITGGKITGALGISEDVDWYKFESTSDYFEVNFDINPAHLGVTLDHDWVVDIYDSKMNMIQSYTGHTEFNSAKQAFSGTIFIKVYAQNSYWDDLDNIKYDITVTNTVDSNWEDEFNNNAQQAQVLKIGEKYTASLYTNEDIDMYKITSLDYFNIAFGLNMGYTTDTLNRDWIVTVYDSNLKEIYSFTTATEFSTINLPFSGTIYIKVCAQNSYWDDLNNIYYDLTVNAKTDELWESEYNNTTTTASTIKQGKKYSGNLYVYNDTDYYKFKSTTNAFKVSFDIDLNEVSVDEIQRGWRITVYPVDSSSKIASFDVDAIGSFKTHTLSYPKGKEYFVKVEAISTSYAPEDQTYHITVEDATNGKNWELENGTTDFKSATAATDNKAYYGNIGNYYDSDYYKYTVAAAGKVKISFNRIESEMDERGFKLELKKSSGTVVSTKIVDDLINYSYTVSLAKGTYYLVISPYSNSYAPSNTIDYNIKFTFTTLSTPTLSKVAQNGAKTLKATWKKSADVTGYEIQYSTVKTFKSSVKSAKIKSNKTVYYNIKKLAAKKTYYVRIRTYKTMNGKTYYSNWTSAKSAKTK